MRLSEIEGEEALDLLADLLDPVADIFSDPAVTKPVRAGNTLAGVKAAIKGHKRSVIEMLALLDGEEAETYKVNFFTLPRKLLDLFNDPDVQSLFQSRGQNTEGGSSGSATVNTGAGEQ